jgi:hypothetical protein
MKLLPLALLLSLLLSACARQTEEEKILAVLKAGDKYDALFKRIESNENNRAHLYSLEYSLTKSNMRMFTDRELDEMRSHFRKLGPGRYDVSPWLESQGLHSMPNSSAVLNLQNRTLVFVNSGENIMFIEGLFRPLRPERYKRL